MLFRKLDQEIAGAKRQVKEMESLREQNDKLRKLLEEYVDRMATMAAKNISEIMRFEDRVSEQIGEICSHGKIHGMATMKSDGVCGGARRGLFATTDGCASNDDDDDDDDESDVDKCIAMDNGDEATTDAITDVGKERDASPPRVKRPRREFANSKFRKRRGRGEKKDDDDDMALKHSLVGRVVIDRPSTSATKDSAVDGRKRKVAKELARLAKNSQSNCAWLDAA